MQKKTPGFYVRIDQRVYADPKLNSVSKAARAGWLFLTGWAKDLATDGAVTETGLRVCDVSASERDELVAAGLLVVTAGGWKLPDFENWQLTTSEIKSTSEAKRAAGKRGAAARWGAAEAPKEAAAPQEATPDSTSDRLITISDSLLPHLSSQMLAETIGRAWPAPSPGWEPEKPAKAAKALEDVGRDSWREAVEMLNEELRSFYARRDTEPQARTWLASPASKLRGYIENGGLRTAARDCEAA